MIETLTAKLLQRYWRLSRGLTMGAQGIVRDTGGRVLLIRHTYRKGWFFPGGGVERGETVECALTRELAEEAGVVLAGAPILLGLFTNFEKFPGDHIALFDVEHWRQELIPVPNAEIAEQGFFPLAELPPGTSDGTRRRIAELVSGKARSPSW